MRISDWSSDVCSSDLVRRRIVIGGSGALRPKPCPRPGRLRACHRQRGDGGVLHAGAGEVADQALRVGGAAGLFAGDHFAQLGEGCRRFDRARLDRMMQRSEEHTSELQSLMRITYAVFCVKKKNKKNKNTITKDMTIYIMYRVKETPNKRDKDTHKIVRLERRQNNVDKQSKLYTDSPQTKYTDVISM